MISALVFQISIPSFREYLIDFVVSQIICKQLWILNWIKKLIWYILNILTVKKYICLIVNRYKELSIKRLFRMCTLKFLYKYKNLKNNNLLANYEFEGSKTHGVRSLNKKNFALWSTKLSFVIFIGFNDNINFNHMLISCVKLLYYFMKNVFIIFCKWFISLYS